MKAEAQADYIVVKALQDGVSVIGLSRGTDTKLNHTEMLDDGEVLVAQFTEHTSMIKIRGEAQIMTGIGSLQSEAKK
ncbi:trp RNA-binding attenuation protein MtrB [Weizmannia coagulans]|jgi:transcription attenuation protein (tryptophan RNA-binding attenuator protein)|uniref:Transcription attenuation protein MtrB n=2 Tax=Heyndrickxia TaxID=2837504 RepID=A0A0C5CBC4_HEYCO|nr:MULTISPECIES: trp RNA-binding attenuation protein MtrB [Heyndrickxia]NWN95198.1 trp RNA-binding attenuation protein MtrB [Bacillus sp. (in: firmicutes)]AJO22780.1 transcription attenuation protein MtrB [Heyndrickxia coagulans]AKN55705.1 Transcription attenuation protein mtrB [Heyndrickxia coagulans]APB36302.1 protein MtrB [Heyndrickxia coagulans]ATW83031.1 trp RNA-binding attenuation protein MtrB [Heyndrickxia coagulans]